MAKKTAHRPSLFWPLILIGVGTVLLLSNLGLLPANAVTILWRMWPLLLILVGLDILLGRRSALGSIISSLLVVLAIGGVIVFIMLAQDLPAVINRLEIGALRQETIEIPRDGFDTATVTIDWAAGPADLFPLEDSNDLLTGRLNYYGELVFEVEPEGQHVNVDLDTRRAGLFFGGGNSGEQRWEIGLHPAIRYELKLDAGSGKGSYDLRGLNIQHLDLDAGSGDLTIRLPQAGQAQGLIDAGSGEITLVLPPEMEAEIRLEEGSGAFWPSDRFARSRPNGDVDDALSIWRTADFATAADRIVLEIDGGSGSIRVE